MRAEDDVHTEGRRPQRGRAGDPPETGQLEGGARNVMSQQQFRFPPGELPGSGELVGFDGSPCGCQDEQHREIGGGVGEDAGSVTDDDVGLVAAAMSMLS